jgi:LacI family fructose operon transcriptional repressor
MSDGEAPETAPKTVDEVARATGCSPTTVRLVVGGKGERYRIKAETRARIESYVATHGLVVNHAARSLKLKRSEAIGLVVPDLANPFFARVGAELEDRCRARGLVLLTASTKEDPERERRAVAGLAARGVDGLMIAACRPQASLAEASPRRPIPTVLIDRAFPELGLPTVVGDNRDSAKRLTERLFGESHGPIRFLCGRPDLPSIADRIRGFLDAHRAAGRGDAAAHVHPADVDDARAGIATMRRLLADGVPPVFMCSSMHMLEGALTAIVSTVGRVPAATVIGTFDHHPLLDFVPNRIVSVRQDEAGIAERAFALLCEGIDGEASPAVTEVVPSRLADHW